MMKVVDATVAHAEDLLSQPLRQDDVDEWVIGTGGRRVSRSVMDAMEAPCYPRALLNDQGRCICLWGVSEIPNRKGEGVAWLIATKEAEAVASRLHRMWKREIALMHSHFDTIYIGAYDRNELHLKWVHTVGFQLWQSSPVPLFNYYVRNKDNV